jgi:hypothetical protein
MGDKWWQPQGATVPYQTIQTQIMKKLALVTTIVAALALPVLAETLEGEATCAKCTLKQVDKCQFAITVEKNGKKETILAEQNDVAKKFHENICKTTLKVKAEGTITEKDGKKLITLTKVEEAK